MQPRSKLSGQVISSVKPSLLSAVDIASHGTRPGQEVELEVRSLALALEAKLQENDQLKKYVGTILENLDVGILVVSEKRSVKLINQAAADMIGTTTEEIIDHSLDHVWEQHQLPTVPFSAYSHQGRTLECRDQVLRNRGGLGREFVRIIHDKTSMVSLTHELKEHKRLSTTGNMIGRIAHEIRNPLGSIELFASLLGTAVHSDVERRTLAEHISTVVRTLDQILSNLLVMTGPPRLQTQALETQAIVHDVIMMAMQLIRQRGVTVREELDPRAKVLFADGTLVKQALLNILVNAIQVSPEGGEVEIQCRTELMRSARLKHHVGGEGMKECAVLVLSVRDYGYGIDGKDQPHIFDAFFSKREGGTGLGLAIVRQVMENHGGWIEWESQRNKGTVMALCFPQGREKE